MASIIISILVSLLGAFLTALFKKWFGVTQGSRGGSVELLGALGQAKEEFLSGIRWRIWLGPNRMQWASALYDRAQNRLSGSMLELSANAGELAAFCTDGLAKLGPQELAVVSDPGPGALKYRILPNGLVKGGSFSYSVDRFGVVSYLAAVTAGKWIFTKTYNWSGTYKVDPAVFDPKSLVVGKVIEIGLLQMRIVSISPDTAMVALLVKSKQMAGTAILGTTGAQILLCLLDATGSVSGYPVTLSVRQEA